MRVWTVSEVKAGTLTQCLGVARHFDPDPHRIIVARKYPWWRKGPLALYRRPELPEPEMIVSCGSMAPRHVFAIAAACRKPPFTVHLQTPQPEFADRYDLAFIGRHDWNGQTAEHPNFHRMIGAPHQITHRLLAELRAPARRRWGGGGGRIVCVLVGGPTQAFAFDEATIARLAETIRDLAAAGWTALVSTSRRSPPELLPRLLALRSEGVVVWDRTGENPYREFLAAADALLVTEDTVTMTCEALSTGRPVYTFGLPGIAGQKFDKFQRFHKDLQETLGLTRPFAGRIEAYDYRPPDEARRIADVIEAARHGAAPPPEPTGAAHA